MSEKLFFLEMLKLIIFNVFQEGDMFFLQRDVILKDLQVTTVELLF